MRQVLVLVKLRIVLMSAASAAAGLVAAGSRDWTGLIALFLAVSILAAGSAALNQYQERISDATDVRTRRRPLPSGKMHPATALTIAMLLLAAGSLSLLVAGGSMPAALGLSAVVLYNGVYTPLKQHTSLAVLPGALAGAIPPAIGWAASGRSLEHPAIAALVGFILLWQVPHSWLLHMSHNDTGSLRIPVPEPRRRSVLAVWLLAALAALAVFPLAGTVPLTPLAVGSLALVTAPGLASLWFVVLRPRPVLCFRLTNVVALGAILLVLGTGLSGGVMHGLH